MKREIKFRAWDKSKKRMFEVICLDFKERGLIGDNLEWHKDFLCVLLQYTGLKDKNGKEIYDGDIVKLTKGRGEIQEVEWSKYGFWQLKEYNPDAYHIDLATAVALKAEIIGNIYKNPELLK